MTYEQTLDYLYKQLPIFQNIGGKAFNASLDNIRRFCAHLGNPHTQYPTLHIAGTNGKGSSSHMLAAVLQAAGYKVGLYTSPHLKSFTERVRVNGQAIAPAQIVAFVQRYQTQIESWRPSFFEVTVAMALDYFAQQKVDVAVIEVGLGGRLDATNIVTPEACLITNISFDHQQILGNTLKAIAKEKAGIIKLNTPVVIGERQTETTPVFETTSQQHQAPLYFAQDEYFCKWADVAQGKLMVKKNGKAFLPEITMSLKGSYQEKNINGVLKVLEILQNRDWQITQEHIIEGLQKTVELTQLKGRWQVLKKAPLTICDTAHNEAGLSQVMTQLQQLPRQQLHIVLGAMADKVLDKILPLFPMEATYYFCAPAIPRAMEVNKLKQLAAGFELRGLAYASVMEAYTQAQSQAQINDVVFAGGSTFVLAEIEGV
ncbi:bifunctional folylpolyglutamate synthase/dihydrofolate synthase [Microscilla marina]|uniref:Dihydrofolate synthase/folylpolyglutamate synthase n=1 Tax=Microscilla marina ATCC 23134 TaxID=313606 RepID=A1ZCQ8_MICM2|nr:folylpolyglutamate synthase/dihydrofolate synthase family protein [Microscilla marina]EAY32060.1 folylpolyglutamate synthase [Microscilla marina ATCC 23134]